MGLRVCVSLLYMCLPWLLDYIPMSTSSKENITSNISSTVAVLNIRWAGCLLLCHTVPKCLNTWHGSDNDAIIKDHALLHVLCAEASHTSCASILHSCYVACPVVKSCIAKVSSNSLTPIICPSDTPSDPMCDILAPPPHPRFLFSKYI